MILFVALISRAFQLQIISGQKLRSMAERQHTKSLALYTKRGAIVDRNGQELAVTVLADSVYVDPSMIKDREGISTKLSSALYVRKGNIKTRLSRPGSFSWVARQVSPAQAQRTSALNLHGVYLVQEPKRFYPHKELACHIIGFTGYDSNGLEGLELGYNGFLKDVPDKTMWKRDAKGNSIYQGNQEDDIEDVKTSNLILTIDSKIQYIVETQLVEAVKKADAKGGVVIVMDSRTGEVLAMANMPHFNPNAFSEYSQNVFRNRAVTDCFDPGSIFKPFLMAAALEEGIAEESDVINCEKGAYVVGDRIIHEAHNHRFEKLTFREVLKCSSNIGSVKIAERLGKEKFFDYLERFGFGSKTDIDLPGEIQGIMRNVDDWTDVDLATIAFGQGISVTAIQLIAAVSAIANDGVLMKPHIVRGMIDKDGQVIKEFKPAVVRRVISPVTSERIRSMMADVVEDGTGKRARMADITVAGKTGTSQKFDFSKGVYSSQRVITSFVGFLPADNPHVSIFVMLDEPKTQKWGGEAAAPVFKNIAEQILRCFSRDMEPRETIVEDSQGTLDLVQVSTYDEFPRTVEANDSVIPDFRGMSMRQVLDISREMGMEVRISGSGWAIRQDPAPGSPVGRHQFCRVSFGKGF